MARLHTCRSLCHNSPQRNKDESTEGLPGAPTKGNNTPTPSPAISWTPIPVPAPAPAPLSINKLLKQFMKTYLESNQRPS